MPARCSSRRASVSSGLPARPGSFAVSWAPVVSACPGEALRGGRSSWLRASCRPHTGRCRGRRPAARRPCGAGCPSRRRRRGAVRSSIRSSHPASELKVKLGVESLVRPDGPGVDATVGAVVSTVQVELAGVASMFPAWSTARTSNLCEPSASEERLRGEVQAPPGRRLGRVEPALEADATPEPPVSVPEKAKLAEALLVSAGGPESIEVVGAVVSTVQVELAGVASMFPAWSTARTSKVWRAVGERGVGLRARCRLAQAAAAVESSRHWKLATPEPPVSVPENEKLAEAAVGQRRRAGVDRGGRRGGVDGPGRAGRGRVDVPGLVDRPDFEFVASRRSSAE